jgi:hypothetical protein
MAGTKREASKTGKKEARYGREKRGTCGDEMHLMS